MSSNRLKGMKFPERLFFDALEWLRDNLNPDDIFTEVQLRTWAQDMGLGEVDSPDNEPLPVIRATRYDSDLDEIVDTACNECGEKYRILDVWVGTVEVECGCGPSEFDREPPNEMHEAEIRY